MFMLTRELAMCFICHVHPGRGSLKCVAFWCPVLQGNLQCVSFVMSSLAGELSMCIMCCVQPDRRTCKVFDLPCLALKRTCNVFHLLCPSWQENVQCVMSSLSGELVMCLIFHVQSGRGACNVCHVSCPAWKGNLLCVPNLMPIPAGGNKPFKGCIGWPKNSSWVAQGG